MTTAPDRATRARDLLVACQDRVYNICFQVLRQAQDAEDAAQEALLKIVEKQPENFAPWMYRVALNTALNALKQQRRRRAHELRRAAMADPAAPSEEARDAVHVAIADLDDDHRDAVLQHFFERRTLEDIARDRNCSTVAIWKRIERAKEELKTALLRSGLASIVPHLDPVLGSIAPVAAPPGLLTDALVAKASALLLSPSAVVAGGIAMTAKGFSIAAVAAISLLLFLVGIGAGTRMKSSHAPEEKTVAQRAPDPPAPAPAAVAPAPPPARVETVSAPKEPLLPRLQALAKAIREMHGFAKQSALEPARYQQLVKNCSLVWGEIREQAYAEPAAFFAFLRAAENQDVFGELLQFLGSSYTADPNFPKYPPGIVDGLVDLLATGTKMQRRETATYVTIGLFNSGGAGLTLLDVCFNRLPVEKDPDVLATLINQIHINHVKEFDAAGKIEARLDLLRDLWQANTHWSVREQSLEVLAQAKTEAGQAMFAEKMEETLRGNNKFLKQYVPQIFRARLGTLPLGGEDRVLPIFTAAFQTTSGSDFVNFASMSFSLPLPKAERVLQEAFATAPTADAKASVERALNLIRSGETRPDVLQQSLFKQP